MVHIRREKPCMRCGCTVGMLNDSRCAECARAYSKKRSKPDKAKAHEYYLKNRERILARRKDSYRENPEKFKERTSSYRKANPEKSKNASEKWRKRNMGLINERQRRLYADDPERAKEYRNAWKKRHPDRYREQRRQEQERVNTDPERRAAYLEARRARERDRRDNDPLWSIRRRIRLLVARKWTDRGWTKRSKTQKILGCSHQEFLDHIRRQMLPGMTMKNYGTAWHLDHIVPTGAATNEADLIELNRFENFRPLAAEENIRKRDSMPARCEVPDCLLPIYDRLNMKAAA